MARLKDDPDELRQAWREVERTTRALRDRPHRDHYVAARRALDDYWLCATGSPAPEPPAPIAERLVPRAA